MVSPMLRRVLLAAVALVIIAFVASAVVLVPAHVGIRREHPPLPAIETVQAALSAVVDGPVRLRWIVTSSQAMPRSMVLGSGDPHPDRPYRLCHSAFAVEWEDGRILLIDAGMTRAQAAAFGAMGEWAGAEPIEVATTVAAALGPRVKDAAGVVFTHLHVDHVDGVRELCAAGDEPRIDAFLNSAQAQRTNHTTGDALATVRSLPCLRPVELAAAGLLPLEGFPGAFVIPVAGHTPGSQVIVIAMRDGRGRRAIAFTGDVVNHIDGVNFDIGKPALYRALVVPEDDGRLSEVRRFLRDLRDIAGFELLVSHDEYALASSSVARSALAGASDGEPAPCGAR
jgi:glyoxylase-like metal-dependent hydrolase (beta-lactamase superfamily II)